MMNQSIQEELMELKEQLLALKSQREAQAADKSTGGGEDEMIAEDFTSFDESGEWNLADHLRGLKEDLNQGLKESDPKTLLLVFAMGVLVGRTLSK